MVSDHGLGRGQTMGVGVDPSLQKPCEVIFMRVSNGIFGGSLQSNLRKTKSFLRHETASKAS